MKRFVLLCFVSLGLVAEAQAVPEVALITALQGKVMGTGGPVESFVKVRKGDVLTLSADAQIQLVYFDTGRQEAWSGKGKLEIQDSEGSSTTLAAPQVKQLPLVMVKQLARTPSLDSQGRAGVMRLRSIPTPESIAKIEENYKKLREEAPVTDKTPELYLLSGLFEMHELDRVEQVLADLKKNFPEDREVKFLASLYGKALKDARRSAEAEATP